MPGFANRIEAMFEAGTIQATLIFSGSAWAPPSPASKATRTPTVSDANTFMLSSLTASVSMDPAARRVFCADRAGTAMPLSDKI